MIKFNLQPSTNNTEEEKIHKFIIEQVKMFLADPTNRFIDRVDNILPQLVENWCLVHTCTLIEIDTLNEIDINQCKNRWKTELLNAFGFVANRTIKDNDSYNSRINAITEGISYSELLDNEKSIYNQVRIKFINENIKIPKEIISTCVQNLIEHKPIIIDLLAKKNIDEIFEYINKI